MKTNTYSNRVLRLFGICLLQRCLYGYLLFLVSHVAISAPILDNDLPAESFRSWTWVGDVSIQDSSSGMTPPSGNSYLLLTTLADFYIPGNAHTEVPYSETGAVDASSLLAIFGLPTFGRELWPYLTDGRSGPAGDGSAAYTTRELRAGDTVAFDYAFVTLDPADQAYFAVLNNDTRNAALIFLTPPLSFGGEVLGLNLCEHIPYSNSCEYRQPMSEGWKTESYTFAQSGNYTYGFGMWEIAEGTIPSVLAIESFRLQRVSEPSIVFLLALGLPMLILIHARNKPL